jgi:cell division septation protein DedD
MDPQAAPAAVVPAGGSVTPAGSDDATAPAATGETGTPATSAAPAAPAPVPAATAPVSAVPPAAVAGGGYTVTIGSFANAQTARELENKLRSAGLAVRRDNVRIDGRDAVRLRVGPYADRALAEAARLRADTATGLQSRVDALDAAVAMPPPPRPASGTAATASAPRVAANVGFAVQLAAPASEGEANALRDRARAAGFVAFVQRVQTEGGARYRVRLGPEADRAAADALRAEARSKLGIDGIVVSHP